MSFLAAVVSTVGGCLGGALHARALWAQASRDPHASILPRVIAILVFFTVAVRAHAFLGIVGWLFGLLVAGKWRTRPRRGGSP